MRAIIKVTIVLFGLGFVGSIFNETPNYYIAGGILVLGVFYVLFDHYNPLELKKKHKETILLIMLQVLDKTYNREKTIDLLEKLMRQIRFKNNVGDSTVDTCDRIVEDSNYLLNQYSNFDSEQRKYMQKTIEIFLNQNNLSGAISLESINEHLEKLSKAPLK